MKFPGPKAMGLSMARSLSFDDVEYDILAHQLTEDQIAIYDTYATVELGTPLSQLPSKSARSGR